MKIAGVSINLNSLPSKKQILKMALTTKKYQNDKNAEESINLEIEKSGLYRNVSKRSVISDKPTKTLSE